MKNKNSQRDLLPETFATEEEAGEFWDTHSTADYEEYLEPAEMEIVLRKRHYFVEIDQDTFMALFQYSQVVHEPLNHLASKLLQERLATEKT